MEQLSILYSARSYGASDIHLVAGLPPAFRINGEIVMGEADLLTKEEMKKMVDGLLNDEQKKTLKETMQLCFSMSDEELGRFRVSIYHRNGSPEFSIRMCNATVKSREDLGLPKELELMLDRPSGIILVTGPTGVGKTTTLNYMIDYINCSRSGKIITIEDPIEFVHDHKKCIVVQQELKTDVVSFQSGLVHVLRQDPDVIGIGEMRDHETIETALTAAETGHLVIATLHTPNVHQTIERIIGAFPPAQQPQIVMQLSNSIQGIIAQQLVPAIDKKNRFLAYEFLSANTAVRNIIRENESYKLNSIIETGSKSGMKTMDSSLSDLYEKGMISFDSLLSRAVHHDAIRMKYNRSKV